MKKYRSPTKKKSPSSTRNHTSKLSPIEMKERERRMKKGISEGQKLVILSWILLIIIYRNDDGYICVLCVDCLHRARGVCVCVCVMFVVL